MKPLLTLQDADIFPNVTRIDDFSHEPTREAVKILLFDFDNLSAFVDQIDWRGNVYKQLMRKRYYL